VSPSCSEIDTNGSTNDDPASCVSQIDNFEREVVDLVKPQHGTTTLGFIFEGGVIIAVDSRATMGPYVCKLTEPLYMICFARFSVPAAAGAPGPVSFRGT
jgi:hypothetical protein